jgi:hypothetical protein
LHGAIALVQMHHMAVTVAENLHFDVLGARDVAFEKDRGIAEGAAGFALRFIEQIRQIAGLVDDTHAAATAAERGLDDERETDLLGHLQRLGAVFNWVFGAGQHGHADFLREGARGGFITHHTQQIHARAHEGDAGLGAGPGELGVLGQKSVTGMNEVDAFFLGEGDDAGNVQVRADGALALAHDVGFVRLEAMDGQAVFRGVNGDGAQAEFGGGAKDADGDFAAVGDEQFSLAVRFGGYVHKM